MSLTPGRTSVILVLATLILPGAGPPEVVRVRVPASKVGAWFPPGTETHGLAADRFETLVRTARESAARRARSAPPRLLRARHFARWESGVLVGRSELVVEPSAAGPAALVLEPWTPAIEPPADGSTPLRVQDSGRTTLLVEASEVTTLELPWQLLARPRSKGRGFSLGMPATDMASLRLELPEGWVPEGPEGIRQGPDPGPGTGRATWRFDCKGGLIDLRLRARDKGRDPSRDPRIWVSGPTRIELREASASWTTEWSVSVEPRGPRRFAFELDPGLKLIDVNGPGVAESRVEPLGPATRVMVALGRDVTGPTPVTIRATAPVPAEGTWSVPAARPLDALWTGGVTTVRLDGSRALRDCVPGAGRRIAARPGEPGEANALVFEAEAPRSVATLVFRGPESDASVEVRGQLLLGNAAPRLEGQLTWRVHRGRPLRLDVDLPPGWMPDRLHVAAIDEPVAWHPEALPDGGVRVHVVPPAGDFAGGTLVLNLAATSTAAGGPGPLALPRVRPVGVRVADELWVAWAESGLGLRPTSARGLAWIDPRLVLGPSTRRPEMPTPEREALAWRWITDQAEALVERRRVEVESSGSINLTATVDPDRLRLDWRIGVEAGGEPLRSLPLAVVGPIVGARDVTFLDEATGMPLARRPLDARRRAAEGLPESGDAWELARPGTGPGRVTLRARLEVPWSGRGTIPLLALPERFQARGLVLVAVNRGLRSTVESRGLRGLDPMVVGRAREAKDQDVGDNQPPTDPVAYRWAHAFGTAGANADDRLELRTERLEPSRASGVIGEAILTTYVAFGGASRQHLVLRVVVTDAAALEVTLPDGATLARARRDGQAVAPTRLGRGLAIPLAAPQPSRTFSTIVLDYLTPQRPSSDPTTVRPEWPATSLPCVGFRWQVVAPEPWVVARSGPGLVAADPVTAPPWTRWPFGSWRGEAGDPSSRTLEAAMLRALDERVVATRPEEVALGEWFMRWDSGIWPLVIDRLALCSAGWGPKSRVLPPRTDPARRGAARAAVRSLGLAVVPIGGVLLITTQAEAPNRPGGPHRDPTTREAWAATLREASAWGADPSDRFQSVARWRGEVTPKAPASSEADDESAQAPAGWRVWRFAAPGWPGPDALVRLVDERSRAAWCWAVALAVLVVGIAAGRLPAPTRAAGLTAFLAVALLAAAIPEARASEVPCGAIGGALAVLCFWLGQALPRRIRGAVWESRASTTSRATNLRARLTLLVLVGCVTSALSAPPEPAGRDREPPILALFPFDGPADPSRAPDRVLLRLEDYDRLRALAEEGQSQAGPGVGVGALAASHCVAWQGDRDVVVASEFELSNDARSGSAEAWDFPVEGVRDVSATLDDVAVPVLVRPGGQSASVLVTGRGRHRLRVRRTATPRRGEAGLTLSLPINPVASARVAVAGSPSGERVEVPNARGRIDARDGGLDGALGPVGRLEARWLAAPGPGAKRVVDAGAVEGLILWDAEPAGDHIRARLTYRNPEGTSVLRLALDPGLVVRPVVLPGLTDVTWEGTAEHPEWVASVDPPVPCGATVALEMWRPSPPTTAPTPTSGPSPADEPAIRPMPRIEPLGVERFSGAVAFRRPPDWLGRLAADAVGGEAITDKAFVKAWGNLPEEPLTLSGAARFFRAPAPAPRTGPVPDRMRVQTRVQLDVGAGRVGMDLEADLAEVSGWSYRVELEVPADLRLVKVEADGLTDWSRTSNRIRLRFDGPPLKQRAVRIQGWMAAPADLLTIGAPVQEIAAPWPRWVGVESRPGFLTVVAPTRAQLVPAPGLTLLGSSPTGPGAESGTTTRYRIDQVDTPLRLPWEPEPPRVTVQERSQMTVQSDSAEWVAVLRYDVTGGAIDAIPLKLPTAWAAQAQARVVGAAHQLTSETRGATTFWMIRPEHPIWGSQRLVVRSTLRFERGETLAFPDLAPLRIGSARESRETFLRVVNATGRDLSTEGSPGVQATDPKAMFRDELFTGLTGLPANTYRVRAEGWSLKVQLQSDPRSPGADEAGPRVSLADFRFTLASDGSTQGMARYDVEPRSGPFLPIELAGGAEPLWMTVNDLPTRPWREAPGRWLVPLEGGGASQVVLIWRGPSVAAPTGTERPTLLPSTGPARVPTLVTVRAPEDVTVRSLGRTLEPIGPDQLELARAEWSARRIVETLGGLDRGSLRDRVSLISALVRFELRLRSAERAALWGVAGPPAARDERARQVRARGRGIRASLTGAIETAALDEFAQAAQVHLGLAHDTPSKPALEIPEPTAPVRACRLGLPRCFQGESGGRSRPPSFAATTVLPRGFLDRDEGWAMVLAALAAPVAIAALVRRASSMGHRVAAISLALILAAAAVSGPWMLAAALVMTALGLFAR